LLVATAFLGGCVGAKSTADRTRTETTAESETSQTDTETGHDTAPNCDFNDVSDPCGRATLIDYIFSTTTLPDSSTLDVTVAANPGNNPPPAKDIVVDVGPGGSYDTMVCSAGATTCVYENTSYLFTPADPNGKFAIVHQGHGPVVECSLPDPTDPDCDHLGDNGVQETAQALVDANVTVAVIGMPGVHTNRISGLDTNPDSCPGASTPCLRHNNTDYFPHGEQALRPFIAPSIAVLNHHADTYQEIMMVGISGGGYTTTVVAAIDDRVDISIEVAGSLPNDYRQAFPKDANPLPDWQGDFEQSEILESGLSYEQMYVLGADSADRSRTQVLNPNDSCCFHNGGVGNSGGAAAYDADYKREVIGAADQAAPGSVSFAEDWTIPDAHSISQWTIEHHILPALQHPSCAERLIR